MARRDLAGLAALGALGMMMSKKKQSEEGYTGNPMDSMTSGTSGGDFIEAGSGPVGDFMSEKEPGWNSSKSPSRPTSGRTSQGSSKRMSEAGYTANPMDAVTSKSSKKMSEEGYSGNPMDGMTGSTSSSSKSSGTYRDLSGKVKAKSADTSAEDRAAAREKALEGIKGAASSFGDYMSGLGKREEKHGTYVKDGKVVRYAKGGMTSSKMMSAPKVSSASKRADGIASKGKTRGKLC